LLIDTGEGMPTETFILGLKRIPKGVSLSKDARTLEYNPSTEELL